MPIVNQNNSDEFFEKLKKEDEECYKEFIKLILKYKDEEISIETLAGKVEDILNKYPDLLEEAMLFIDYKKLNTINYKKSPNNKNNTNPNNEPKQNSQTNIPKQEESVNNESNKKKEDKHRNQNIEKSPTIETYTKNDYSFSHISPKMHMSSDYIFFSGLKDFFPPKFIKY